MHCIAFNPGQTTLAAYCIAGFPGRWTWPASISGFVHPVHPVLLCLQTQWHGVTRILLRNNWMFVQPVLHVSFWLWTCHMKCSEISPSIGKTVDVNFGHICRESLEAFFVRKVTYSYIICINIYIYIYYYIYIYICIYTCICIYLIKLFEWSALPRPWTLAARAVEVGTLAVGSWFTSQSLKHVKKTS